MISNEFRSSNLIRGKLSANQAVHLPGRQIDSGPRSDVSEIGATVMKLIYRKVVSIRPVTPLRPLQVVGLPFIAIECYCMQHQLSVTFATLYHMIVISRQ